MNSSHPRTNESRIQVTISMSKATFDRLEELSEYTNLSRSRIYELACIKFADWSMMVTPELILALSEKMGPDLGYKRKQSGFRKAVTIKPVDPYATEMVSTRPQSSHPGRYRNTYKS